MFPMARLVVDSLDTYLVRVETNDTPDWLMARAPSNLCRRRDQSLDERNSFVELSVQSHSGEAEG